MSDREQLIQREIMDWLQARLILHWRQHIGAVKVRGARIRNPLKGYPDLAGIVPNSGGRLFAIEVKQEGGRFSWEQVDWMTRLKAAGVLYIAATSVEDVARAMDSCQSVAQS